MTDPINTSDDSPLRRFERSMAMDVDAWRDGRGYDLDALAAASATERVAIEQLLINHQPRDWNDIEALCRLNSAAGNAAIVEALDDPDPMVRVAVLYFGQDQIDPNTRTRGLVAALKTTDIYGGLTQALMLAEEFHPPPVIDALWRGTRDREGEVAMHFAALLMFLHGQASEAFDWDLRPFFLTFHTEDPTERSAAFRELCQRLEGVRPLCFAQKS